MRLRLLYLFLLASTVGGLASGCGVPTGPADPPDDTRAPCGYPDAVAPMAEGEAMEAYRWPAAKQMRDESDTNVDLASAYCDSSDEIDWSPFDVLLFVSIPAW